MRGNGQAKLRKLIKQLEATPKLMAAASKNLAEEALNLNRDQFRNERNPYDEPWQPKLRPDGRKTLSGKTSRLKNFQARPLPKGFQLRATVSYATFHQNGTVKMVARLVVPTKARGLPPAWRKAFTEVITETVHGHFE